MSNEVVPFGKYKGQPVEVLAADAGYRDWLLMQPWFRERFTAVYQTIINYGAEPQETPEHNQMQASFLDDGRCLRLARLLLPNQPFDRAAAERVLARSGQRARLAREFAEHLKAEVDDPRILGRKFEQGGWDVVYRVEPAGLALEVRSLPACACGVCDHDADCPGNAACRGGGDPYRCQHRQHTGRFVPAFEGLEEAAKKLLRGYGHYKHCAKACPWADEEKAKFLLGVAEEQRWFQPRIWGSIRAECKPDLGDDFPAVLRQVTRYDSGREDRRCVVVRRAGFQSVTWEQVVAMFGASGVVLLRESQLSEDTR